ncbi:MAG: adenylosuccinate lyase [Bacteroidetes bacterium]|nr:adenylosuccinate lyase [Bacteroidota bacterium]
MEEQLRAISPVDGRYHKVSKKLGNYFSEFALIQYRVRVEIEYFIALCEIPLPQLQNFNRARFIELRDIYLDFSLEDAQRIKEIERTTNHDVKAVEYFIKEHFEKLELQKYQEFIHFGLTSQDINNTAVPLSLKEYIEQDYLSLLGDLVVTLSELSNDWADIPMLARTHGQPASPTRLGKEIQVFVERLDQQMRLLRHIPFAAKFGGATGNFNAHHVAYPNIDWQEFGGQFVSDILDLQHSWPTTQIEHYDHMAALFDCLKRINTIILDLNKDMWTYISMDYFKQRIKEGEVGSSAMPHKVNPIDFENSEGNLGIANALFEHLSSKLPVSRLQRDLTDSTVLRNIGVPLAHTVIALNSTMRGLGKVLLNPAALNADLEANWAVVAEAIQNILRREAYPKPYEALKALTRTNEKINAESIANFIEGLAIDESVKAEMRAISPQNYTGI